MFEAKVKTRTNAVTVGPPMECPMWGTSRAGLGERDGETNSSNKTERANSNLRQPCCLHNSEHGV